MRTHTFFLGLMGYSVAAVLTANASTAPRTAAPANQPAEIVRDSLEDLSTLLLHEVQRIRLRGTVDECAALEPIPVYDGAPSARDWQTYCEAIVTTNAQRCDDITATIHPDLRSRCGTAL